MKKLIIVLGLLFTFGYATACDLCSIYLNLEPNDLRNSFGMNYRYRLFSHDREFVTTQNNMLKHAAGNTVLSESINQQEVFKTVDVWSNFFIAERWQLNLSMSFSDNQYIEDDSVLYSIGGIGDANVLLKYLALNTKDTDSARFINRLIFGGGIKLPTGSYNDSYTVVPSTNSKNNIFYGSPYEELDPHLQAGTGSFDFLILMEYLIRYKKIGLSTNFSYRINTENSNDFKFANRFNTNASLFAVFNLKSISISPNFGTAFEISERDKLQNEDYLNSGGNVLFLSMGTKLYYKDVGLGMTYFNPVSQNLNDDQIQNDNRVVFDLSYYF